MTKGFIALVALLAVSGCAQVQRGGTVAANPLVQGMLNVATYDQCKAFAERDPQNAQATADYLSAVRAAALGCEQGVAAGLPAPTPAQ